MLTVSSVQGPLSGLCCVVTCWATLFSAAAPTCNHRASLHAAVARSLIILTYWELFYGFLDITLSFQYNPNYLRILGFTGWMYCATLCMIKNSVRTSVSFDGYLCSVTT
uniref:Uncharacterized protein n=1 Tax=Ixodes ricinus TaxID=34613 RepID=A0A6B0UIS0_IXORI